MTTNPYVRKWYLPLTVLSLGGLGAFFLTEPGRRLVRWVEEYFHAGRLQEWNETAQRELDRIQVALDRVAESLQVAVR